MKPGTQSVLYHVYVFLSLVFIIFPAMQTLSVFRLVNHYDVLWHGLLLMYQSIPVFLHVIEFHWSRLNILIRKAAFPFESALHTTHAVAVWLTHA